MLIVFASIRVTLHAILEVGDAFLAMLAGDIRFVVLMAAVTGVRGVIARMTGGAGDSSAFTVVEREGMLAIEFCRGPGGGAVTGHTVGAELSSVLDRLRVA